MCLCVCLCGCQFFVELQLKLLPSRWSGFLPRYKRHAREANWELKLSPTSPECRLPAFPTVTGRMSSSKEHHHPSAAGSSSTKCLHFTCGPEVNQSHFRFANRFVFFFQIGPFFYHYNLSPSSWSETCRSII